MKVAGGIAGDSELTVIPDAGTMLAIPVICVTVFKDTATVAVDLITVGVNHLLHRNERIRVPPVWGGKRRHTEGQEQ